MNIYIDTEFNDFKGELISLALVADDGGQFYEVLNCENPSPWVKENVMTVLEKGPIDFRIFQKKLERYLQKYKNPVIIADWPDDTRHFCNCLIIGAGRMMSVGSMSFRLDLRNSPYQSKVPHNALWDALAIKQWHVDNDQNTIRSN